MCEYVMICMYMIARPSAHQGTYTGNHSDEIDFIGESPVNRWRENGITEFLNRSFVCVLVPDVFLPYRGVSLFSFPS